MCWLDRPDDQNHLRHVWGVDKFDVECGVWLMGPVANTVFMRDPSYCGRWFRRARSVTSICWARYLPLSLRPISALG